MKSETFTAANVRMFDLSTKKRVPVKLGCDDPYPSDPSKLLGKRTKYKVVILGGAGCPQNIVSMPLEASYVWTFTTGRR